MSLAGAIEAMRKAAPLVPSSENRSKLMEAAPIQTVLLVPSESPRSYEKQEYKASREDGANTESQNEEVSNSSLSQNQRNPSKPLSDLMLAELIAKAAHKAKLSPADLWTFLSLDDLEALRTGDPDELKMLQAFAASRSRTSDRTKGGHDLPFPSEIKAPGTDEMICCGDCVHFQPDWIGDGHGMGHCRQNIKPQGGPIYPRVERICRGFCRIDAIEITDMRQA